MNQVQLSIPKLTPLNKILIFGHVGFFLLDSILGKMGSLNLSPYLGLSSLMFFKGHIYQLITYSFLGASVFEVLFNCLILWFIGAELEGLWGKKRYGFFVCLSVLGGGLLFVLTQLIFFSDSMLYGAPLHGMGGVTYALLVAYAILFPNRTLYLIIFPVRAKYFCLILIAMQVYQGILTPRGVQAWGHLGAMAFGVFGMWFMANSKYRSLFFRDGGGFAGEHRPKKRRAQHLRLVETDSDDDNNNNNKPPMVH